MGQLDDKIAIVTGGGRGIGRGIVFALAQAGADIVIADVDLVSAEQTAKEVEARGRQVLVVRLDVTNENSVREGTASALERFGRVDILINNAGVVQDHVGAAVDQDDFDRCFQVNLRGIWTMTSALAPHLRERKYGKIVNIASIAGRKGGSGLAPYCASKAGAISLTQVAGGRVGTGWNQRRCDLPGPAVDTHVGKTRGHDSQYRRRRGCRPARGLRCLHPEELSPTARTDT